MIIIGLLLLLLVAAIVLVMVVAGNATVPVTWDALNLSWNPSALVIFGLGALTLLLLVMAVSMLRSGTKRRVTKSQELRRLRQLDREQQSAARTQVPAHDTVVGEPAHGMHQAPRADGYTDGTPLDRR